MGSTVQISLSPWLLSVAKISGSAIIARHEIALSPAEWEDAMLKAFRPFDAALAQALRVLNVAPGARAMVDYAGRDAVVDLLSYPSGGSAARDAAALALSDRLSGGSQEQPTAAWIVGRDAAEPCRTHVLACADKDQNVEAIASWVRRGGLRLKSLSPAPALALAECAQRVLETRDPTPVASIYFGGSFTCIAAGSAGRLLFVRVMNFGVDLLSDSYARERSAAQSELLPEPDVRRQARESVWSLGIPSRSESGGGYTPVLPLIVPVIQKFLVEIKQTIRFGCGESELTRVNLTAIGPGASIPNLAKSLSEALDLPMEISTGSVGPHSLDHAELGVRHAGHQIDLSPASEVHARSGRRLTAGVAVGAALALAAVGLDAGATYMALRRVESQIAMSQESVSLSREHFKNRERAALLAAAFRDQHAALAEAMAPAPEWSAILAELGRLADQRVRLTQLNAENNAGKPRVEITGLAFTDAGGDALRDFMNKLMRSPLAQAVELGPTRAAEAEGRTATHFTLTALLRALPADPGAESHRAAPPLSTASGSSPATAAPQPTASASQEDHR